MKEEKSNWEAFKEEVKREKNFMIFFVIFVFAITVIIEIAFYLFANPEFYTFGSILRGGNSTLVILAIGYLVYIYLKAIKRKKME